VILDLHMPVMTGWELLDELRRRGLTDVPVCVTSALSGRAPAQAVATLSKPFNTSELIAVSSRYCTHPHVVR
jgi:CheY-like chemotaxis protein